MKTPEKSGARGAQGFFLTFRGYFLTFMLLNRAIGSVSDADAVHGTEHRPVTTACGRPSTVTGAFDGCSGRENTLSRGTAGFLGPVYV